LFNASHIPQATFTSRTPKFRRLDFRDSANKSSQSVEPALGCRVPVDPELTPDHLRRRIAPISLREGNGRNTDGSNWVTAMVRCHLWPLTGALAILLTGMIFSFWWNPLTHQGSGWYTPSDIWDSYRAAQYVGWGFEGEIYKSQTYFDSFPGIAVLLAPIAKLAGTLHLSESFPLHILRPSTWLLLGPTSLISGGFLLFPLDLLARRLFIPKRGRVVLMWIEAALIWPTIVLWGHPEYAIALAFGIYGVVASYDGKWVRVGIFMGLALLFQPFTALIMPLAIIRLPARRWIATASIIVLPSLLLLVPPLVKEWHATTFTLLRQPNYPIGDHPTPWMSLAPVLQKSHRGFVQIAEMVTKSNGTRRLAEVKVEVLHGAVVAAGPGRLVALLVASIIGVYVAKTKPSLPQMLWWVAVTFALRCVFECVMNPYYLLPASAIVLVLASRLEKIPFMVTSCVVAICTLMSYQFMSPWPYYSSVTGSLLVALALTWPHDRLPSKIEVQI
jgi:hypothetical protein